MDEVATLELKGIRKTYNLGLPSQTEVLHSIDLQIKRGEFVALIGPSGSGKSTLLNLIGLLDKPNAGELLLVGEATTALKDDPLTRLRARAVGFVFQFHNLLPEFTAIENVMLPLLAWRGYLDDAMRLEATTLIEEMGLQAVGNSMSNDLSGGQQQRVAIARALIMGPSLVLADEPTGNLDTASADSVFRLLREINKNKGTSFLIVTHDPRLALRCDRIIELVDGRIATDKKNTPVISPA